MSLTKVKVEMMKDSGMSFSKIAEELDINMKDVAMFYVEAKSARKKFEKRDKTKIIYRKRLNPCMKKSKLNVLKAKESLGLCV